MHCFGNAAHGEENRLIGRMDWIHQLRGDATRVRGAASRKREYGTYAWSGLAEPRLRPPAIAPSGSGAGRIIPGGADAAYADLLG